MGVPFLLIAGTDVRNNGPLSDTMGDVTMILTLPADCSTDTSPTMLVPGTDFPLNTGIFVTGGWNVTCLQAGPHNFGITASVAPSDVSVTDPNPANNSASGSLSFDVS